MYHYDNIDTNWDNPDGWARSTGPFLNSLHPVTANLVEYAIRVRGCYSYPVVQQFILRADAHIRKILESSDKKTPSKFCVQNYSAADYAKVAEYVRHLIQIFSIYYDTNNQNKEHNSLKCVDMSVANLADFLNSIESQVENKLSPLCGAEEVKRDIYNLLTYMDEASENALGEKENLQQKKYSKHPIRVLNASDKFENPHEFYPPSELVDIESGMRIDCPNKQSMEILAQKLRSVSGIDISLIESGKKYELRIYPSALRTDDELSVTEIQDRITSLKQFFRQNGCQEFGFFTDDYNWKLSNWRILRAILE